MSILLTVVGSCGAWAGLERVRQLPLQEVRGEVWVAQVSIVAGGGELWDGNGAWEAGRPNSPSYVLAS